MAHLLSIWKGEELDVTRLLIALALCVALAACGGSSGAKNNGGGGGGGTGGTNPPATTPPAPPTLVSAGSSGVDITVPGPSTTPAINATVLGAAGGGGNSAFGTGDFVHRNSQPNVLLFGPGLSGTMTVRIGGSGDVSVVPGSQQTIKATDGTPGILFQVNVPAGATLGARSVYLISGNDMTVFAGGLEVVP